MKQIDIAVDDDFENQFASAFSAVHQFGPKWGLVVDMVKGSCELYLLVRLVCWFCEMV